jgi:hypothetical protein
VFKAVQAHWLSACMHVMLELRVADALVKGSSTTGQQGMHVDEVRDKMDPSCFCHSLVFTSAPVTWLLLSVLQRLEVI